MKSKSWVKDRYFDFQIGDVVKLVRKKKNGHPRALELGNCYKVIVIQNEDLFVAEIDRRELGDGLIGGNYVKVNKYYFAPLEKMRDELINDILGND
jgi:hypothetical protein